MKFQYALKSDVGRKREQNQDNAAARPDLGLFVVADGMGGHRGGETASRMVAEIVPERVLQARAHAHWEARRIITEAITAANNAIYDSGHKNPQLQGMGTTTTAVIFSDGKLVIGHVGDSRCYLFRPGGVWQITRDHSLVQEKLRAGLITREQLKTDRMKNVLTRSVGYEPVVNVELYQMQPEPQDVFLLCSDGLSGLVEDKQMLEIVETTLFRGKEIEKTVQSLIDAANSHGGDDNITALLIQLC